MTRRVLLLSPFVPRPEINDCWSRLNDGMDRWAKEWNAMARDPGTRSVGEHKAFEDLKHLFRALEDERKKEIEGK